MNTIKVRLYGLLQERANKDLIHIDGLIRNSDDLLNAIHIEYPSIKEVKYVLSINRTIVKEQTNVTPSDEIALLPPFSGG